jgi:hypothetical protein
LATSAVANCYENVRSMTSSTVSGAE